MQKQIDDIRVTQEDHGKMITEIHNALVGTPYTGKRGMIDDVDRNTDFRVKFGKYAAFFVAIGTFIGGFLSYVKLKIFGI